MESFSSLFKKENMGELILVILLIIYLILGLKTPEIITELLDTLVGKITIFVIIIYLFIYSNPILSVLALFTVFELMRRNYNNNNNTGLNNNLQQYAPSEIKKSSQFTAFNQFPYTLEQEVVAKMAPITQAGNTINTAPYKPLLENNYDAFPIHSTN